MIKTVEFSGRTEDEAIEIALEQLNLTRDDVSVEIIERAKTGFLGLKNTPAIVKIQYESNEPDEAISTSETKSGDYSSSVESFLEGLFERMDISVSADITETDGAVNVILTSSEPGALIGRRGETLDAIQHLTNYVVNRGNSSRIRINLDAENYRQRRNDTLESLAAKTADKVLRYRKNMTLEPMNAYERHVIHAALQEKDNISTFSVGTEPNRRVVVSYGRKNATQNQSRSRTQTQTYTQTQAQTQTEDDSSNNNSTTQSYREWS